MKNEKTRAWENVRNAAIPHPVSSIIYTDEDIVIASDLYQRSEPAPGQEPEHEKDGTVHKVPGFMQTVRALEKKGDHPLALFKDHGRSAGELHTGVVVIFPGEQTEECLGTWGIQMKRTGRCPQSGAGYECKMRIQMKRTGRCPQSGAGYEC